MMLSENNTVFGESSGNSYGAGIYVNNQYAESLGDTVYSSDIGVADTGGLVVNDRIYGDKPSTGFPGISAAIGLLLSSGTAQGNTIYNNTTGTVMDGTNSVFVNNTLYGNTDAIQVGRYSSSSNHTIDNNTIIQSGGWALNLSTTGATGTSFYDNILSLSNNAVGIIAPAANQTGFASDYNLYDLETGATVATWSGQSFATLDSFKTDIDLDLNSIAALPDFVNPATNNYALQSNSPAVNRGDPALAYDLEPAGNGDRIDIGAQGGTALANPGAAQLVQLLGQTGDQRYQVGQTATIAYTSAGLVATAPLLQIATGNEGAVQGADSANAWQAASYATTTVSQYNNTTTVNANGLNVPQAILQNYATFYSSTPATGAYSIPVPAGTYQISLVFVEPSATAAGQRTFNIIANGVTEAANYDIFKAAGGANKATELTFTVTVGSSGLNLQLVGTNGYPILNGIIIDTANSVPAPWTANASVSYDNGATWAQVATGLSFDPYGGGSFSFTPTQASTQGLLRLTATNGSQTVTDTSLGAFMSIPAGNQFYVSTTGSDSNSGTSASSAMASVAALLNVYKMIPGDVINVAAGTYNLPAAINLGATDSGAAGDPLTITGAGASTIFKVSTSASNTEVFNFTGAHDVTLENFSVVGGSNGVNLNANAGATDITLQNLRISGFANDGVSVGTGAANFSMTGSTVTAPAGTIANGVAIDNSIGANINGDTFSQLYTGVNIFDEATLTVENNIFTNDVTAINANYSGQPANSLIVSGNTITTNVNYRYGIYLSCGLSRCPMFI